MRAILGEAARDAGTSDPGERFADWLIRMTRPGVDLDAAIEENRATARPDAPKAPR